MVSFSCEECGDVLTKKKLDPHRNRCHSATFTCIDCMVHFPGVQYRSHTSCMTEDQKYQGALYKEKPNKRHQQNKASDAQPQKKSTKTMSYQSYVEDAGEDRDSVPWGHYDGHTDDERSPLEPPPEAPTPPPAVSEEHVNVFDFLVATGQTPNASNMNLHNDNHIRVNESTSLVRYEYDAEKYLVQDDDEEPLVEYGSGPVPPYVTPGAKGERRKDKDGETKKDKKRKRLHLDVPADQVMTDAPPVLHSGLTGGLKSLMRPIFPPSPDYSGADNGEPSPTSPLKKTKHSRHNKTGHASNSIFDMITGGSKSKPKSKSKSKSKDKEGQRSSRKHREHREEKESKLIEFRTNGTGEDGEGQMIVFKPRADVFLGFVNKGPESDKGCSINKALKRYHRERQASGSSASKSKEEKELFRSLRLRKNDRGEIVIYGL